MEANVRVGLPVSLDRSVGRQAEQSRLDLTADSGRCSWVAPGQSSGAAGMWEIMLGPLSYAFRGNHVRDGEADRVLKG